MRDEDFIGLTPEQLKQRLDAEKEAREAAEREKTNEAVMDVFASAGFIAPPEGKWEGTTRNITAGAKSGARKLQQLIILANQANLENQKGNARLLDNVLPNSITGGNSIKEAYDKVSEGYSKANEDIEQQSKKADEYHAQEDKSSKIGDFWGSVVRGTTASSIQSLPVLLTGGELAPYLAAYSFGVSEANSGFKEAKEKGMSDEDALSFAIREGVIEAGISMAFTRMGHGGFETMFAKKAKDSSKKVTKEGLVNLLKETSVEGGKSMLDELPEELITEIFHNTNKALSGVEPDALSQENLINTIKQTVAQTILQVGGTHVATSSPALTKEAIRSIIAKKKQANSTEPVNGNPPTTPVIPTTPIAATPETAAAEEETEDTDDLLGEKQRAREQQEADAAAAAAERRKALAERPIEISIEETLMALENAPGEHNSAYWQALQNRVKSMGVANQTRRETSADEINTALATILPDDFAPDSRAAFATQLYAADAKSSQEALRKLWQAIETRRRDAAERPEEVQARVAADVAKAQAKAEIEEKRKAAAAAKADEKAKFAAEEKQRKAQGLNAEGTAPDYAALTDAELEALHDGITGEKRDTAATPPRVSALLSHPLADIEADGRDWLRGVESEIQSRALAAERDTGEATDLLTAMRDSGVRIYVGDPELKGEIDALLQQFGAVRNKDGTIRQTPELRKIFTWTDPTRTISRAATSLSADYRFAYDTSTGGNAGLLADLARAARGEKVNPESSARFATRTNTDTRGRTQPETPTPGTLTAADRAALVSNAVKAFRAFFKTHRLHRSRNLAGDLAAQGYTREVSEDAMAALFKRIVTIAERAWDDPRQFASLLMHEAGHAFMDSLPKEVVDSLRELHKREIANKTGPLFRDGKLINRIAFVEEDSEKGFREWFAERVARINEQWAQGRITTNPKSSLILHLAEQFRNLIHAVFSKLANLKKIDYEFDAKERKATNNENKLFEKQFRAFMLFGTRGGTGRQEAALKKGIAKLQQIPSFFQAWHGSPHKFDKFNKSKIGTGEGNQAFGHGLYFTDKKDIAEHYSKAFLLINGHTDTDYYNGRATGNNTGVSIISSHKYNKEKALAAAQQSIDDDKAILARAIQNGANSNIQWMLKREIDESQKAFDFIQTAQISSPNLYNVKIHGNKTIEQLNFVEWMKPPNKEQVSQIKLQAEKEDIDIANAITAFDDGYGFASLYHFISNRIGQKATSEFLLRAGIDGIRYPANSLSGHPSDETNNYVVFDDNAVEIQNRIDFSTYVLTEEEEANVDKIEREVMDSIHATGLGLTVVDMKISPGGGSRYITFRPDSSNDVQDNFTIRISNHSRQLSAKLNHAAPDFELSLKADGTTNPESLKELKEWIGDVAEQYKIDFAQAAKGRPKTWDEVRQNTRLVDAKNLLPKDAKKLPKPIDINLGYKTVVDIVETLLSHNTFHAMGTDGKPTRIKIDTPDKGTGNTKTVRGRAEHLVTQDAKDGTGKRKQELDKNKLETVRAISFTLADPQIIGKRDNTLYYLRRYENGTRHVVVVDASGYIKNQYKVDGSLVTQFPMYGGTDLDGAFVVYKKKLSGVNEIRSDVDSLKTREGFTPDLRQGKVNDGTQSQDGGESQEEKIDFATAEHSDAAAELEFNLQEQHDIEAKIEEWATREESGDHIEDDERDQMRDAGQELSKLKSAESRLRRRIEGERLTAATRAPATPADENATPSTPAAALAARAIAGESIGPAELDALSDTELKEYSRTLFAAAKAAASENRERLLDARDEGRKILESRQAPAADTATSPTPGEPVPSPVQQAAQAAATQTAEREARGYTPPLNGADALPMPDELTDNGTSVLPDSPTLPDPTDTAPAATPPPRRASEPAPDPKERNRIEKKPEAKFAGNEASSFVEPAWWERWAKAFVKAALYIPQGFRTGLRSIPATGKKALQFQRVREGYAELKRVQSRATRKAWESVRDILAPITALKNPLHVEAYEKSHEVQHELAKVTKEISDIENYTHEQWKLPDLKKKYDSLFAELKELQTILDGDAYYIFQNIVVYRDLLARTDAKTGIMDERTRRVLDDGTEIVDPIMMPFGLKRQELIARAKFWESQAKAHPDLKAIAKAIKAHSAAVLHAGELMKKNGQFQKGMWDGGADYFPHIVIDFFKGKLRNTRMDTQDAFRSFLMQPIGSRRAIETDYIKAMMFHFTDVYSADMKEEIVQNFIKPYDISKKVEEAWEKFYKGGLDTKDKTWMDFIPKGYVRYTPNEGDRFHAGIEIDRAGLGRYLGAAIGNGTIQAELQKLGLNTRQIPAIFFEDAMIKNAKVVWVLPEEVAEAANEIRRDTRLNENPTAVKKVGTWLQSLWKKYKLFSPHNTVRYNFNNLSADSARLLTASGTALATALPASADAARIVAAKTFGADITPGNQLLRDIHAFFTGDEEHTPQYVRDAFRHGVFDTPTENEINRMVKLPGFEKFATADNVTGKLWDKVKFGIEYSRYREAAFRLALYKHNLDRYANGAVPDYGGAYWRSVENMEESAPGANDATQRKAAAISLATLNDYGMLSPNARWLRTWVMPFFAFRETSMRWAINTFRNGIDLLVHPTDYGAGLKWNSDEQAAAVARAKRNMAFLPMKAAAGLALRTVVPLLALAVWNDHWRWEDEGEDLEGQLSEGDRDKPHLILGKFGGKVLFVNLENDLDVVFRWIGGSRAARAVNDTLTGRKSGAAAAADYAANFWRDGLNEAASTGPIQNSLYTAISGYKIFPDVTKQHKMQGYEVKWAILEHMLDNNVSGIARAIVDKDYYSPKDFAGWAAQAVGQVRSRDPEQAAYYSIRDKAEEFQNERKGRSGSASGGYTQKHDEVLRNFRRAIYKGDVENAVRFYGRLVEEGYTAEQLKASIKGQDPLGRLSKEDGTRKAFVESLTPFEKEELERAWRYYHKMSTFAGSERKLFPRKGRTATGTAANILRFQEHPKGEELRRILEEETGKDEARKAIEIKREQQKSMRGAR